MLHFAPKPHTADTLLSVMGNAGKKDIPEDALVILNDTGGKYVNFKLAFPNQKDGVHDKK